jgi:hypothetical protein
MLHSLLMLVLQIQYFIYVIIIYSRRAHMMEPGCYLNVFWVYKAWPGLILATVHSLDGEKSCPYINYYKASYFAAFFRSSYDSRPWGS